MRFTTLIGLAALTLTTAAQAAPNLVQNGGFETSTYTQNSQFGTAFGGQGIANWTGNGGYNLYEIGGTQSTTNALGQYAYTGNEYFPTVANVASPNGGNFVALDGDAAPNVQGAISQMINGLTVGKTYTLAFNWAASQLRSRSGSTSERFGVTLGSDLNVVTPTLMIASQGFSGWKTQKYNFTATTGSAVLNFLSMGTPSGLPPVAFLDGVSVTQTPEPAALGLMGLGMAALALRLRRRQG